MENYYTPELEELHMGLEVEINIGFINWIPYIIDKGSFIDWVAERRNREVWIRIKDLEREDIVDLGFEHMGSGWFKKGKYRIRKWVEYEVDIYLWAEDEESGNGDIIFSGSIKNKGELKQILKQLNIN